MASIATRTLDHDPKRRRRAAQRGRAMEDAARAISRKRRTPRKRRATEAAA